MDMSVIDVNDGVFEILATDGDLDLGGSVIDEKIVDYLVEEFKREEGADLKNDPMSLQRLYEAAEKAKIELSSSLQTDINLPYITSVNNVPKHLVKTLSRSKFDQMISEIVDRTIEKAKSSLSNSGLKTSEINDILLVGGSTRIPLVQERLEKEFGIKPNKSLNPDTCVSSGATRQGGVISGHVTDILLLDVTPLSLGIEMMGGVFQKIIEANTTIPTSKSKTFTTTSDNQNSVDIHCLQGERSMAKDNKSLGRFILEGIMSAPRGIPKIEVTIDIDANGILSVSAKDQGTGKENKIRIEGSGQLSSEEIERMKKEAELNAENDRIEKEKVEKLNEADSFIFKTEKSIKEFDDKLTDEQKNDLKSKLDELKNAYNKKEIESLERITNELNSIWHPISESIYNNTSNQDTVSNEDKENTEDISFEEVK